MNNKMLSELQDDQQEMAAAARELFAMQKEFEAEARSKQDRGKALAEALFDQLKCDRITFSDGYYLTKQETVRVTYNETAITQALLAAGFSADKVKEVLVSAGKPTHVVSIFGRAPKE